MVSVAYSPDGGGSFSTALVVLDHPQILFPQ